MSIGGPTIRDARLAAGARFSPHLAAAASDDGLLEWGRRYLPHFYTDPPSDMHGWLDQKLTEATTRRGVNVATIGPRGSAKSTIAVRTYGLRGAVEGREKFTIIVSDTAEQANQHLDAIKVELESNRPLRDAYPNATGEGPMWRQNMIQLRNGCVIRAIGTGTKVRGSAFRQNRPSLILLDDPENDTHISSTLQRGRLASWMRRTLMNLGDSRTNVVALGTALHRAGLVMTLTRTPGWTTLRDHGKPTPFKAIRHWPKRMDLWDRWEEVYLDVDRDDYAEQAKKFFRKNERAMREGAELLWPEREDLYYLMKLRAEIGHAAFESEKQGNPIDPATCEWPEDYFTWDGFYFDEWPADGIKIISVDPSKGKDAKRSDYSAIVTTILDHRGRVWIDADLERRPTGAIVARTLDLYARVGADRLAIEINAFQELLAEEIKEEAAARGMDITVHAMDNRVKKEVRVRRVGPLLGKKRIRVKSRSAGAALLVSQWIDFPNGDHDDGPDAAEMGIRSAFELLDDGPSVVHTGTLLEDF